jgi:predicted RNase H-like HicB family nuclease
MADLINVNITQSKDGSYSATIREFPSISARGCADLEQLREALEIAISLEQAAGGPPKKVKLPRFIPGQVTRL